MIDTTRNVAYFVSNRYVSGTSGEIGWYMHAIELSDGKELASFPVKISGGAQNLGSIQPQRTFEPLQEMQRPGLLMMNGVVYAGFGSHCDIPDWEGWIVGVSAASGAVVTKWETSPYGASIWQSGGGLVSDGPGQILLSTGNTDFEVPSWDAPEGSGKQRPEPEGRLGESVVRAEVQPSGELATSDYFSPFNSKFLDEEDLDLGSSAPVALPSTYFASPTVPHLMVQESKEGAVYLLNRDGLGGREKERNNVVQELRPPSRDGVWGAAAVWPGEGGYVDVPSVGVPSTGHLHVFKYGENAGKPVLSVGPTSAEAMAFGSGSPIVTSNGTTTGSAVLWITWCPRFACENAEAELRAYSPASAELLWQEKVGFASKFSRPVASNGHIYVGNREGRVIGFSGPAAPTVVTEPASSVTKTGATLNAAVNPNGVEVSDCHFEYGATTSYGSSAPCTPSPGSGTSAVAVSAAIAGLSPNTAYHFRISATNAGGTSTGADQSFTTLAQPPPTVVTGAATSVTQTSATLNASVNPNGSEVSDCHFEYGPSTSYGTSAPCAQSPGSGTSPVAVSAGLESLAEGATYHFRIVATSALGGTSLGSDATFTTTLVLGPHWYEQNVRLAQTGLENGLPIISWGHLTLESTSTGAFTCQTLAGGEVANPLGGGAGKGSFVAVTSYDCQAPTCEAAKGLLQVIPEKLAWSSVLIEETGTFRDRIEGISLRAICVGGEGNVEFHGPLKPELENGTAQGSAPANLEFGATSGSLQSAQGPGAVRARLKFMGFEGEEFLRARKT